MFQRSAGTSVTKSQLHSAMVMRCADVTPPGSMPLLPHTRGSATARGVAARTDLAVGAAGVSLEWLERKSTTCRTVGYSKTS
eukprot:7372730-Prymnesium_polylepis.1